MASVTATTYRSRAMCVVYTESHFAPGHDSRLPVHTNVVGAEKRAAIAVRHAGCSARQAGVSALWAGDARTGLPPRSRAGKQPTRQQDRKTHPSDQTLCIHSVPSSNVRAARRTSKGGVFLFCCVHRGRLESLARLRGLPLACRTLAPRRSVLCLTRQSTLGSSSAPATLERSARGTRSSP